MPLSLKNMLLLAKVETTAGTDATPVATTDAILIRGLTPRPIESGFVERNLIRGSKGNFGQLSVGVHRMFEFEIEVAGSGTAGTAPKWGPLLKACGFGETITAGTEVVYAPVSGGEPTLTMYAFVDGTQFRMTEAKGTVSFEFNAMQIPVMIPNERGGFDKNTFDAKFTRIDTDQVDEYRQLTDLQLVRRVCVGWKMVDADTKEPVDYSDELLEQVLKIPGVALAMGLAFWKSLAGARTKN